MTTAVLQFTVDRELQARVQDALKTAKKRAAAEEVAKLAQIKSAFDEELRAIGAGYQARVREIEREHSGGKRRRLEKSGGMMHALQQALQQELL